MAAALFCTREQSNIITEKNREEEDDEEVQIEN